MRKFADQGIVLVLLAIILLVLAGLIVTALHFSQVTLARTRHQNLTNILALASLKGYMQANPTNCLTPQVCHQQRQTAGIAHANEILSQNKITGFRDNFEPIALRSETPVSSRGGKVEFGNYYPDMLGALNPCTSPEVPPCFVPATTASIGASAARISFDTTTSPESFTSIARFFGIDSFSVKSYALASLVQQCVELLLDASLSVTGETHRQFLMADVQGSELIPLLPPTNSYFAYRADSIGVPPRACTQANLANPSPEFVSWCTLGKVRMQPTRSPIVSSDYSVAGGNGLSGRPANWANVQMPPGVKNSELHYQSDYSLRNTGRGQAYVYTFRDSPAEPLTSIYRAFNAVTRLMRQNSNPIDRAGLIVFARRTLDEFPLSQDYGPIIQLTNMDLMGRTDVNGSLVTPTQEPNFLSRGHITFEGDPEGQTNLTFAFTQAFARLSQCPREARKSIIIATDGMGSCSYDAREPGNYFCGDWTRPSWQLAEDQIGGDYSAGLRNTGIGGEYGEGMGRHTDAIYAGWPLRDLNDGRLPVIEFAKANQISVTSIMSGDYLGLNFRNVPDPTNGGFLDFASAAAQGWHGRTWDYPWNHDVIGRISLLDPISRQFMNPMNGGQSSPWLSMVNLDYQNSEWSNGYQNAFNGCIAEHLRYQSKFGSSFPGWWCDYNTWSRYFAGVAPGIVDRRPMWTFGELSMRTGGLFCGLMPKCNELPGKNPNPDHWYICPVPLENGQCPVTRILNPTRRAATLGNEADWGNADNIGTWQNCSVLELSKSQQAEKCALDAIGQNSYMLMRTDDF